MKLRDAHLRVLQLLNAGLELEACPFGDPPEVGLLVCCPACGRDSLGFENLKVRYETFQELKRLKLIVCTEPDCLWVRYGISRHGRRALERLADRVQTLDDMELAV